MFARPRHAAEVAELIVVSIACLVLLSAAQAIATPLDQAACDKAKADQAELADVPRLMERGAEWARTNAKPEQLKRVARWIELEERLQFRCGLIRLTPGAERAAAEAQALEAQPPPAAKPGEANATQPAAGTAISGPAQTPAGTPQAGSAGAPAAEEAPKPKAKPKPKPKPKPKQVEESEPAEPAAPPTDAPRSTTDTPAKPARQPARTAEPDE